MVWTFPKTWFAGELVTAALLNTHLRDNLNALHVRPKAYYDNISCSYSTTSTSNVAVDSTNLNLSIETTGGDVLVLVQATVSIAGTGWLDSVFLVPYCDGQVFGQRPQVTRYGSDNNKIDICFFAVKSNLTIWTHDFALYWRVTSGATATMTQVTMLVREIG